MNWFVKIWNAIRPKTQREIEDEYLSKAVDLADLERRMKILYNKRF